MRFVLDITRYYALLPLDAVSIYLRMLASDIQDTDIQDTGYLIHLIRDT